MDIGKNIQKARIDQKMQQQDLAKLSGISQRGIGKIENGVVSPRVSTLEKIADALGVPINTLLD